MLKDFEKDVKKNPHSTIFTNLATAKPVIL